MDKQIVTSVSHAGGWRDCKPNAKAGFDCLLRAIPKYGAAIRTALVGNRRFALFRRDDVASGWQVAVCDRPDHGGAGDAAAVDRGALVDNALHQVLGPLDRAEQRQQCALFAGLDIALAQNLPAQVLEAGAGLARRRREVPRSE
ncbi:hypothetical protein [Devosia sp. LC5]|uniref:hypothetical protein n=1 Tax=Devosia sp. LC5 TaxID=1502724 RepID=UPI0013647B4D|nr:hypothetical protein [Devosia sp. LC5]